MRLLIVEDDPVLSDGLSVGLGLSGFTADGVATLADARAALEGGGFAGMVLDIMLPDGSGLDLLAELRSSGSRLPVLLLTARDRVRDRVSGLDAGADDYLGKPFDLDELAARLRAMLNTLPCPKLPGHVHGGQDRPFDELRRLAGPRHARADIGHLENCPDLAAAVESRRHLATGA